MKEGDVILTPAPQADGVVKNRPAIIHIMAHPGLAYVEGSAPRGVEVHRSPRSQKKRRGCSGV